MNKRYTKLFSLFTAIGLLTNMLVAVPPSFAAAAPGTPFGEDSSYNMEVPHIVINQIYGAGLKSTITDAPISHGFVELYNPTDHDVDLSSWSLQYADRGTDKTTGATLAWNKLNLSGTIKAHGTFLIKGAATGGTGSDLKIDLTAIGDMSWSNQYFNNKGMKVALVSNQTTLSSVNPFADNPKPAAYVDLVGTGSNDSGSDIDGYETAYPTGSAEGTSKKKALQRNGFNDTDNNKADFKQIDYTVSSTNLAVYGPRSSSGGQGAFPAVTISTASLANASVGAAYTAAITAAGGAQVQYTYSASGLPAGLTINAATGAITGTPAAQTAGIYTVEITAADTAAVPNTKTKQFSLTVTEEPVIAGTLAYAYEGIAYSAAITVTGGILPYSYSASGLPSGLAIDPLTGTISGTPAVGSIGSYTVQLSVTDSAAAPLTGSATLPLSVYDYATADKISITKLDSFIVGQTNEDGGIAEIVKFNPDNGKFYSINGASATPGIDVVAIAADGKTTKESSIAIKPLVETGGFEYGDLTSIDVNTKLDRLYVSVQAKDAMKNGKIVVLDYQGMLITTYEAGVQPDMIKATKDGRYILTADEGEPRTAAGDPEGSVTIVDTRNDSVTHVKFTDESVIDDLVNIRGSVIEKGVISGKGTKEDARFDLEPEYLALSGDETKVYVSLQENNAIATIDIAAKKVLSVKGLDYKDFDKPGNELDLLKDNQIKLENVPFKGVYMPDGIDAYTVNGKTYLFSANEGDATDWSVSGRKNGSTVKDIKGGLALDSPAEVFLRDKGTTYDKVEVLSEMAGQGVFLFGGRSFSIWHADTMAQVYDSGSDFELITAQRLPEHFNASHTAPDMDSRSAKKGPEPEYVKVGQVGSKAFAFVGLERVGGIMTYDVTNPEQPAFVNYLNTRDFAVTIKNGATPTTTVNANNDTGPEGLEFIPATASPTGQPLLLVANEVGGTVSVLQLNVTKVVLNSKSLTLTAGGAAQTIGATVTPVGGTAATATWSSSNSAVATVNANGTVTPIAAGTAVITAISADGFGIAEAPVQVNSKPADNSNSGSNNPSPNTGTNTGTTTGTTDNTDSGTTVTQPEDTTTVPSKPVTSSGGASNTATTEVKSTIDSSGHASAAVSATQVEETLKALTQNAASGKAAVFEIKASSGSNTSQTTVSVPQDAFKQIADSPTEKVTISTDIGQVSLNKTAISTISSAATGGDVSVSIGKKSAAEITKELPADVSEKINAAIGNRPIFDFTITAGGNKVSDFNGGTAAISVPYTLSADEDPNAIIIYYITDSGELVMVPNCQLDPATGLLSFEVKHFSSYAVGHNMINFADTAASFAKSAITFLSARNLVNGVGEDRFAPKNTMTRADFALILARIAGADLNSSTGSSFKDVNASAYYAKAVGWAATNGIVTGASQDTFNPAGKVTRAQMAVMIARLAQTMHYTFQQTSAAAVFADQDEIQAYAVDATASLQRAGFISGKPSNQGLLFAPNDTATREEAAKLLALLVQNIAKPQH